MRRVVITGVGAITALGQTWPEIRAKLAAGETATIHMDDWDKYKSTHTRLAAPIVGFNVDACYPRKKVRSMGRVARLAVYASERALADAGLTGDPVVTSGRLGVAYGSSFGSPEAVLGVYELRTVGVSRNMNATNYIRMMGHTAAVNISVFFGTTGRIIPTSSACVSGSMGIGYAVETIRMNKADVMIAGGAEEFDIADVATFDTLFATSTMNDTPQRTPRPFDRDRDGLVIGEGACTLILEEYEHAKARGAKILAEIVGFGTSSDGFHITQPQGATMKAALRLALDDAGLPPEAIGFVNAHGTATDEGDIAESQATADIFGSRMPIHSLKSYFGHTLGACGSLEVWLALEMMHEQWFCPTVNLDNVDPRCAELDYLMGDARTLDIEYLMSNNFAFGGINTSLIIRRI